MRILELGCGKRPYKSNNSTDTVIHLDKFDLSHVEVRWDLEKTPLPFKNNEFDVIKASHVLEHIENLFSLMNECWRILKPNGVMLIEVPYFRGHWASIAPDHKRFFGVWTWYAFTPENYENYMHKARFRIKKIRLFWSGKKHILFYPIELIINSMQKFYEEFLSHIAPAESMCVELEKI